MSKPRVLIVGDAVQQTGFARVIHNVTDRLHRDHGWDTHVLGINYLGDPHRYAYPVYPAALGGDVFGVGRFGEMARRLQPDVIFILQDPWMVIKYLNTDAPPDIPIVAYMPVDGKNLAMAAGLNGLELAVWYTKFGQYEAEKGGYNGPSAVIPHGVDTSVYTPGDRREARIAMGIENVIGKDAFIVGNINRNQPRKRLDLTIEAFSRWWHQAGKPPKAFLYLHCSRFDIGYDVIQLARYYGVARNMIMSKVKLRPGDSVPESSLTLMYRAADMQISTTMGEGWGLTTHESMACGIMQAVPEWSALAEWPRGAVTYVPIESHFVTPKGVNVIGGIPSMDAMVKVIDRAYKNPDWRHEMGQRALACATREEFLWDNVAREFDRVLHLSKRKDVALGQDTAEAGSAADEQAANRGTNEVST